MGKKANEFKARALVAAHGTKPKTKKPARGPSAAAKAEGVVSTAARNLSARAAKKGGVVLEDSASGKPSRKSTRRTQGGQRPSNTLERKAAAKLNTPSSRARRKK